MRLGIHTSISGGFDKAVKNLAELKCNACQIFSRSPRGGKARVLSAEELSLFRQLCETYDINPVVVHIPYVLNLATPDLEMHNYATAMVQEDIERANALGAAYLVLHMGSHRGAGIDEGLNQVSKALVKVLENYDGKTMLLLENTSGGGKEVGFKFEHLKKVLDDLASPKAGICFDTCHGFAAGYDLSDEEKVNSVMEEMDAILGLDNLHIIHANDSMFPLGSTKDRHAHIGKGYIGENGFRAILKHPALINKTFILETPVDDENSWQQNLDTMRSLAEK